MILNETKNMRSSLIFSLLIAAFFYCCSDLQSIRVLSVINGQAMGTTYTIKFIQEENEQEVRTLKAEVDKLLNEINRQMSTYIIDSEISKFNRFNDTIYFPISEDFYFVVEKALEVSRESNGAFDITVGPLVNLWGFGPEIKKFIYPSVNELKEAKSKTGYHLIELKENPFSIKKKIPDINIDLSAIAKGFGVDKIAGFLESKKILNYMVEIGGELRAKGKNQKALPWKIGIPAPDESGTIQRIILISDQSLATSGDYRNYYILDSIRYSHTIDPRTGMPVTHNLASVSVMHTSCTLADAYATVINVLGPEEGFAFALRKKLPAFLITREKDSLTEISTPDFQKFLSEVSREKVQ